MNPPTADVSLAFRAPRPPSRYLHHTPGARFQLSPQPPSHSSPSTGSALLHAQARDLAAEETQLSCDRKDSTLPDPRWEEPWMVPHGGKTGQMGEMTTSSHSSRGF